MFGDWMEKYEHIISLGKELAPLADADRVDDNLIKGCQSRVWLAAKKGEEGRFRERELTWSKLIIFMHLICNGVVLRDGSNGACHEVRRQMV